jgi:predicted enzyme related to lactoylglutathione lyase
MIRGGNATVFVSNMDAAVTFYSETLGLKLTNRFGDFWATVQAGDLTIGLHPLSASYPAPGTPGAIVVGLELDEPIQSAVARLADKGVRMTGPVIEDTAGKFIDLADPDGNRIYLWEMPTWGAPTSDLSAAGATRG